MKGETSPGSRAEASTIDPSGLRVRRIADILAMVRLVVFLFLLGSSVGRAEPVVLRMATQAPAGTAWARSINEFSRNISTASHGQVAFKWYWGGIAGDEIAVLERIRRGQLDGQGGSMFCEHLAPSMLLTRVLGLYRSREENHFVLNRLRPLLEQEFHRAGFQLIGLGNLGSVYVFSRRPVTTFADLKRYRYWVWNLDDLVATSMREMGLQPSRMPLGDARHAYDDGAVDGFLSSPVGALAFQWSSQAQYYLDLPIGMLPGCLVVAQRALDSIPHEVQEMIRREGSMLQLDLEKRAALDDDNLLRVLFKRQGLKRLEPDPSFRTEFFSAAHVARDKLQLAPALLSQVLSWLGDFRGEHDFHPVTH
jgi:TRAP-type C4-dicarboxylate transport system substrate-binding protein